MTKGKGNSKVAKGKQNLNETGFLKYNLNFHIEQTIFRQINKSTTFTVVKSQNSRTLYHEVSSPVYGYSLPDNSVFNYY